MDRNRIERTLYNLTREERMGLGASEARTIVSNLWPAIDEEARKDAARERDATSEDIAATRASFNGTSELDAFARVVIDRVLEAVRRGQVRRAGACGKHMDECGGSCALPPDHASPCRCGGDDGDGCPA